MSGGDVAIAAVAFWDQVGDATIISTGLVLNASSDQMQTIGQTLNDNSGQD